jgi:hypothetical protein
LFWHDLTLHESKVMKMASRSELLPVHLNYFLPSNLNIELQSTGLGFWIWKITARGKPRDTRSVVQN